MIAIPSLQERAANILQCRMPWPLAEQCATALTDAGMSSIGREQAVEVLRPLMPGSPDWAQRRAEGAVGDLVTAGLIAKETP